MGSASQALDFAIVKRSRPASAAASMPFAGWCVPEDAALLTDLYEVTMLQGYWRRGMNDTATFDLFVRSLPPTRRFLVAAGLETALAYLESFAFAPSSIDFLGSLDRFDPAFLEWLGQLRFTGEVWAMSEGEIAFATEPLLRVTAPLCEAQVVETLLLNTLLFPTAIASKAARITIAARGRSWVDFSPRRDHGLDAALKVARSSYVAGAAGTSNVLASKLYGIPPSGTMAHSFVMAFDHEEDAFRAYVEEFPDAAILLVDTYDTRHGLELACTIGRELASRGQSLIGVRLDSGDLAAEAEMARTMLDAAGLKDSQVFASGDLNETRIDELVRARAPIDAFGVGTELGTSFDAPALGGVYKLVEYRGTGRAKRSIAKATLPGRKQVWRSPGYRDVIELADAPRPEGEPLLRCVMRDGHVEGEIPSLNDVRRECLERLSALPDDLRNLSPGAGHEPKIGLALRKATETIR